MKSFKYTRNATEYTPMLSKEENSHTSERGQWQMSGKRSESKELVKRFFEHLTKIETELDKIFKGENGCFTG